MVTKKIISIVLVLCVAVGLLSFASAEVDTSTTTGIDVVVALDMTSSMGKENTNGNDPWGYRIDATAMLIGMMDMDGSRIAIVPFAHVPGKPADIIDFTNVSDASDRIELIGKVYDLKGNVLQPNTNIGSALMKAEQMLLSREDQSNRPMIVLMTDGRNDFSSTENGQDTVPSSLRWKDGQIVDEGTVTHFTKEMADMVTREAVDCAISNNIPIYTVALGQNTATDVATPYGVSLMQISQETGAMECQKVNKEEAYDLPTFFAEILANQIGSSVKRAAEPVPVPDQPGTYEVKIPILNKEVLETNIILPVRALNQTQRRGSFSNINANSIELYDSDGNRKIDNSKEVVILNNFNFNHFVIVKIRKPDRPGMWTLRFKSDTIPNEISFNILYKYSIKYAVDEITNDHNNTELYKTDTLIMNARFVDENGIPVNDSALYQDHTSDEAYEDWMTIRAHWKLYQTAADGSIMGTPVREGMLNNNSELNVFSTTINLAEGGNLKSGNYKLVVSAVGAGLDRTVEYPLTLKNHAPSRLMDQYQTTINVNSPEKNNDDTWKADKMSGNLEKKLSDIIVDQDNDDIKYQLQPVDDAKSYAVMTLEGDTIHYNLIQDGDKVKSGKAEYKLIYDDMDNGGRGEASITLTIYSMVDAMLQDYSLEVKTDGKNTGAGDDTYLKNTPVTITAKLKNNDGTYLTGDSLETLKRQILILDQNGESVAFDAKLEVNEEKDGLEYTVETTGNKKAEWTVTINIDPFESITKVIQIPNDNSPVAMESSEVTINCDGEKVPSFLASIIGENTPEDDPSRSAVIKGMFTDADCDEMVYSSPVFRDPATGEESDSNIISATKEGDGEAAIYTIHVSGEATSLFNYTMNREMHITATDGDGNTGVYVRKITIVDLYKKMITYLLIILIAIVILIILYLIIHQIRKPVFPKLNMTIREEPSLYESGSETLSPVKTYTNLNAIGVDGDMANKHGISVELLQNIIVKPLRSRTAVGVLCKKLAPGHDVMLEDVRMKAKKAYVWKIGQELTVKNENGDGLIAIKLEDRPDSDNTYEEFKSDEWSEIDESSVSVGGRKHSRKAERKAPPVEEQQTTESNDDFDF